MWDQVQEIVKSRNYENWTDSPDPGQYVITGIQAGNLRGERGWQYYIGYVVQVRKKAGAFGSDLVLLRHPDGVLMRHDNQSFHLANDDQLEKIKGLFPEGMTPEEYEDYSQEYTLSGGTYPEIGRVIAPKEDGPPRDEHPMVRITTEHPSWRTTVEVV